jgi:uncharacterized protein YecE (DUF72 family)
MEGNNMNTAHAATHSAPQMSQLGTRLEPMLIRLPPTLAERLRRLARATRIRQSDYLREAVADLLAKYDHVLEGGQP